MNNLTKVSTNFYKLNLIVCIFTSIMKLTRYPQLLLSIVFLLMIGSTAKAQNLGVYPTTLSFKLSGGESEAQVINISNGSKKLVQFTLYLNDWIRDTLGGHAYYPPNTIDRSCSRWVSLDKNFIELQPGESTQLTVTLKVPDSADAVNKMSWSMLFIETVQEKKSDDNKAVQATVNNLLRVGVHIYETPPAVSAKAIKVIDLRPIPEVANAYYLFCQNTGDVMMECKAYLELTSLTSGESTKLENVEFPMFPGQKRYVAFEVPKNMPAGDYSVLGVLDGGEDLSLEAVESNIKVTKVEE